MLQPIILDHLMMGINFFFIVGAVAFLCKITPILEFYSAYKGSAFFINISIVGVITTLFSPAGFIGLRHYSISSIRHTSYKLLAGVVTCLGFSLATNSYGLLISGAPPFVALRMWREQLVKNID